MKYWCWLTIALSSVIACSTDAFSDDKDEVAAALTRFLRAFENGELEVMEAAFASDATSFPRAIPFVVLHVSHSRCMVEHLANGDVAEAFVREAEIRQVFHRRIVQ